MYHRRQRVDFDTAYIEVMRGDEAVRIVNRRGEGMQAVMFTFTGYIGYDSLCGSVWTAMDDRSEAKAEIAKNWLWHLLHDGICNIDDITESN